MGLYLTKTLVSALVIVAVSELAKKNTLLAAALASLPLISLLSFIWLYVETGDVQRIMSLAHGICWLILPSLVFFVTLPLLLRSGWAFWSSLGASSAVMVGVYAGMMLVLAKFGIKI